jgi:hypothetical protein
MNTRFDYDYIRKQNDPAWKSWWYDLLDGRFIVENNTLVEDLNATLFQYGFTVDEVALAIGHTGYTRRELEWYQSQPDRYTEVDGVYSEVSGWAATYAHSLLLAALDKKLLEIDQAVAIELQRPFPLGGNTYYLDVAYIQGVYSAMSALPDDWSMEWKTADKPDGINNVYVTLRKSDMTALALAALQRTSAVWSAGDLLKKQVKALTSAPEIDAVVVSL